MKASDFIPDIIRWEGISPHMYTCTAGRVTVGVGNMLASPDAAVLLPFWNYSAEREASAAEVRRAYVAVAAMRPGMPAASYKRPPRLELKTADINALLVSRLEREFLPGLVKLFPRFNVFPEAAQSALMDIAFNTGLGGLSKFVNLRQAVESEDWMGAAAHCSRKTSRPERNAWTVEKFKEAAT